MRPKVIFFGNGLLAEHALAELEKHCEIIFHAHKPSDLEAARQCKTESPEAYGVLASFGVMIRPDFLALFEPAGIVNLHPSKLPKYRGPSPIESAILAGESDFSYSIMKLAEKMDAGPIYHQATLQDLPLDKVAIYRALATAGASFIGERLAAAVDSDRPAQPFENALPQDDSAATYTQKLDKSRSFLQPEHYSAAEIWRQIIAFQGFPKPKYRFQGHECIILEAHLGDSLGDRELGITCKDQKVVIVDRLQPANKKPMSAIAFLNGYAKS